MLDPRRIRVAGRAADVVVGGHIHHRMHRDVAGCELWLVGDWPGSQGTWLEGYADGRLVRHTLDAD